MNRLILIPVLVLLVIALALGVYIYAGRQHSSSAGTPDVAVTQPGQPPVIASNQPVPNASAAPGTPPLPDSPPSSETPSADKSEPMPDFGPPPALPPSSGNMPPQTVASAMLKNLPASANGSAGPQDIKIGPPLDHLHPRDIRDTFNEGRGQQKHEATDILAPLNTPIKAVSDGTIAKLFLSRQGGITVYEFDPTSTYCYYYAHLDHYAPGLKEGMTVKRGDLLGFVGTTGNAPAKTPHLHFAVFQLDADKKWWHGKPINPYSYLLKSLALQ